MASTTDPTSSAAKEAAIRQRILTHMNSDHHSSLRAFLQHYNLVPASQTKDAKLTDITLSHIILTSSAGRHMIPLDPPLKSLNDSRERMIAMHNEAYRGLGKDPEVTITTYRAPTSLLYWFMVLITIWGFQMCSRPSSLYPGGSVLFDKVLDPYAPRVLISLLRTTRVATLTFLVVAHVSEAFYLWTSRLERYNVPRYSGAWWKWVGTVLAGGFPSFAAFDSVVEEVRSKKKH